MYLFYEEIKKEVDLQDLVLYLYEPLNRLKVLQLKIEEYKSANEKAEEIESLFRESIKITDVLFPDLINNYCKLSLEFRNKNIIKEIKDKNGKIILLTSKDLLLKNTSKLIEHIQLMEEKFYQYFSFDFLVNSRIISELGFQENYIDNTNNAIVLENKYTFSKKDANKLIEKKLNQNNQKSFINIDNQNSNNNKEDLEFKKETKKSNFKLLKNAETEKSIDLILEKKTEVKKERNTEGSPKFITELIIVAGFIVLTAIITMSLFSKIKNDNQKTVVLNQKLLNENKETDSTLKELMANNEKNGINYTEGIEEKYKQSVIIINNIIDLKNLMNKTGLSYENINYMNLIHNGLVLNPNQKLVSEKDMIYGLSAYHIDIQKNKAQLKVSNVNNEECKFMSLKLSDQYNLKIADKEVNINNFKSICDLNNTLTINEK